MTEFPMRLRQSYEHLAARRGLSIQVRLLLLVMAAALPALLFSLFQARTASSIERENAEQHALQLARLVAARVDDRINTIEGILISLSPALRVDTLSVARNDSILMRVAHDLGTGFANLSVANIDGRPVGLSNGLTASTHVNNVDRRYFREAIRTRGLGIGEPMVGRLSKRPTIALGRAILGPTGEPIGVVAASTPLEELRELLLGADLPPDAIVTMMDDHGTVLARTRDAREPAGGAPPVASSVHPPGEREGVREEMGPDGMVRLAGYATAGRAPWTVHVSIPSAVALARVRAQERQALWLFVLSLGLSLLLAWLLARGIAGPVRALTADAEAFVAGTLDHRAPVPADGELGTLADTFHRMIDTLESRGQQLGESERRYRALFNTMPLPMWAYDVETYQFLAVNEAAILRYGYSRDEFLAMTVLDIRSAEDAASFRQRLMPDSTTEPHRALVQHLTRGGERIDVEISSDELSFGTSRARLVVANDVTERRRTETALRLSQEQLRQSQKMEAVGSLAGGIAHDFNNLLTAILGYCDLALEEIAPDNSASGDVHEIRRAALRAGELTHQLLAFSRRQVLKPRVFALGPALAPMEKILRRLISESIALEMDVAPDTPRVRADPTQLEQVVLNLALNARDAMPRGGRLTVRVCGTMLAAPRAVAGTTLPAGAYATLEVADTGTGIAPEVRDRLFEPFFTTKARGQGTGLGLATVYGIVQQSGGGIDVWSEAGVGATFTLYFPAASAAADEEPEAEPARAQEVAESTRTSATILLAEDDGAVRAIAREVLERAGYTVLAAADGAAALALADGHPGRIDLLLTDVVMPGMNGRELSEALAARRPGVPVLFASGYSDNVLLDQDALAPGVSLIDKPFTPAVLVARVAGMLEEPAPAAA